MATLSAAIPAPPRFLALRRLLREPLLHFLLLGALIFAAGTALQNDPGRYRIALGRAQLDQLAANYASQYGNPPSAQQLQALAERYLREEIDYREGLALHLDRDDEIIRRRVVQKYEFLQQDLNVVAVPDERQLQAWYGQNQARYTVPAKLSFTHVYFSPDAGGDATARARAVQALAALRAQQATRAPQTGDRFPDRYDYAQIGQSDVERVFGQSEFSEALFQAPPQQWTGPFRSGYGWHLVYVAERTPPRQAPLAEVREQAQTDYQAQERQRHNDAAFLKLRQEYHLVSEGGP